MAIRLRCTFNIAADHCSAKFFVVIDLGPNSLLITDLGLNILQVAGFIETLFQMISAEGLIYQLAMDFPHQLAELGFICTSYRNNAYDNLKSECP